MPEKSAETPESRLAQACHFIDQATGGISPPLHMSTTYARDVDYEYIGDYSYARSAHPAWEVVEQVSAELDLGVGALCFASGNGSRLCFF